MIKNMFIQRSSANKKVKFLLKIKKIRQTGIATRTVKRSPAVITFEILSSLFSALYLVISLETVIGVPEQVMVKSKEKTDSAT